MKVQDILEEDQQVKVSEIAEQVEISYGSCQVTIRNDHLFNKVCVRWIPHLLTTDQRLRCLVVCQRHGRVCERK